MSSRIFLVTILFFMQACSNSSKDGYYKGYELPDYQVIKQIDEVEFRQYQPNLIAEVLVEGDRSGAVKKGFRILARYIFGNNISSENVSMTSPVVQQEASQQISMTTPVTQISQNDEKWLVRFGMPKSYKIGDLPKAINRNISFKTLPAKKMVALRFSGSWSDSKINLQKEKLAMFVSKQGLKIKGEAQIAYYDDPFTFPWNRRNEILWEIE
jgi:effector-binding domain-containing protein